MSQIAKVIDLCPGFDSPPLQRTEGGFVHAFHAMGSPCEVWIESDDEALAIELGAIAEHEALRIEAKFSRYRPDSVVSQINGAHGAVVHLDDETANLIDYAAKCYDLSDGRFDITSGILRSIWRFDGSDRVPSRESVRALKSRIGWNKVTWRKPDLILPKGMEIDLGGLGKEYAVDCAVALLMAAGDTPVLVNFGGDLRVSGARRDGRGWRAAIESVDYPGGREGVIDITSGALATSGDARRFLLKDGVRYSHILDPRRAAPVKDPPRSVTVAAATCVEAGFLSTLAMLHGRQAEAFLHNEGLTAWWVR